MQKADFLLFRPVAHNKKIARREKSEQQVQAIIQSQMFSGPLPPPEVLTRYNDAVVNGAERILTMAEKQATHRQKLEERVVRSNIMNQYMGSIFGLLVCGGAIGGGVHLIGNGNDVTGLTSIIGALVALVAVFFRGRAGQERERREKRIQ